PIVLGEQTEIARPVAVVVQPAASKTGSRRAFQKALKIRQPRCVDEKQLPVERLWKFLVQVDPDGLAAKPEIMRSFDPTHGIHEIEIVLNLELIGWRRRANQFQIQNNFNFVDTVRWIKG